MNGYDDMWFLRRLIFWWWWWWWFIAVDGADWGWGAQARPSQEQVVLRFSYNSIEYTQQNSTNNLLVKFVINKHQYFSWWGGWWDFSDFYMHKFLVWTFMCKGCIDRWWLYAAYIFRIWIGFYIIARQYEWQKGNHHSSS